MAREKFTVMFDGRGLAVFLPVRADGSHAMRADRNDLLYIAPAQCVQIRLGKLSESQVVAQPPRRIARALLLAQHSESDVQSSKHPHQGRDDFPAPRIVPAHAAEPQAILLRTIEDGKLLLLNEFIALVGRKPKRVAVTFQIEKELGAVIVLPFPSVHRAAPQADDDGQVLHSHRALKLAGAAGGALEDRFLREMRTGHFCTQKRLFT